MRSAIQTRALHGGGVVVVYAVAHVVNIVVVADGAWCCC
jgi:hypothetical protein